MSRVRIPLLAVDGGGTKCLAAFVDREGRIIGTGRAGSCNHQVTGPAAAARELAEAIGKAMSETVTAASDLAKGAVSDLAKHGEWEVECAVFGLAGLDTARDRQIILQLVSGVLAELRIRAEHLMVENDGFAALLGATGGKAGVLIIAGTGSIAYGINRQGVTARAGGWGHRVGDEGSGYWIGKQMIAAVFQAADGRGEPTALSEQLLAHLGLSQLEDLYNWLYGSSYSVEKVGELSPLVSRAAAAGDAVAARILNLAAGELFQAARAVISRLGLRNQPYTLMLQGGVLQHDEQLRRLVVEQVRHFSPRVIVDTARHEPITGVIAKGLAYLDKRQQPGADDGQ